MVALLSILFLAATLLIPAPAAAQFVFAAEADATVNGSEIARVNDNLGCDPFLKVGPYRHAQSHIPDGIRALIRFDVSSLNQPVSLAVLELTVSGFGLSGTPRTHTLNVHRVVDSGARTPWIEGNGDDGIPSPPGCLNPNAADGVAWVGAGDGGDLNNTTQPDFDPTPVATVTVDGTGAVVPGDVLQWDVTDLVNLWVGGTEPNYGLVLVDPTTNGTFQHIVLTSRDAELWDGWANRNWTPVGLGPRLATFLPVSVEDSSWGRVKAGYR